MAQKHSETVAPGGHVTVVSVAKLMLSRSIRRVTRLVPVERKNRSNVARSRGLRSGTRPEAGRRSELGEGVSQTTAPPMLYSTLGYGDVRSVSSVTALASSKSAQP